MNMQRLGALVVVVVAVLAIAGCWFPLLSRAPVVRFHGEATDPIGDTAFVEDVRVARPADLVYASVQVTKDALRLTVRFAPGSLDPTTTGAMFLLDTDLDLDTGVRNPGLGADYLVSLRAGPVREATVARAVTDASCAAPAIPCRYEPFERADVVLSNDEMEAVVSRSAFARFGGRLNFRLIAYANLDGGRQTRTSDHMPNLPAQFIAVR
ncbi:MAG TPA: hypothetical protein VIP11_14060 [Gemmatimonadaceae bacterium]